MSGSKARVDACIRDLIDAANCFETDFRAKLHSLAYSHARDVIVSPSNPSEDVLYLVRGRLAPFCLDLLEEQYDLARKVQSVRKRARVFVVSGRSRKEWEFRRDTLQCSCSFLATFAMPCRHIFAACLKFPSYLSPATVYSISLATRWLLPGALLHCQEPQYQDLQDDVDPIVEDDDVPNRVVEEEGEECDLIVEDDDLDAPDPALAPDPVNGDIVDSSSSALEFAIAVDVPDRVLTNDADVAGSSSGVLQLRRGERCPDGFVEVRPAEEWYTLIVNASKGLANSVTSTGGSRVANSVVEFLKAMETKFRDDPAAGERILADVKGAWNVDMPEDPASRARSAVPETGDGSDAFRFRTHVSTSGRKRKRARQDTFGTKERRLAVLAELNHEVRDTSILRFRYVRQHLYPILLQLEN